MPKPETRIVHLRRVRESGHRRHLTLWFEFEGGTRRASRARYSLIKPQDMPDFDGEEGWFLVERAPPDETHHWRYWRALQQVDPPKGR